MLLRRLQARGHSATLNNVPLLQVVILGEFEFEKSVISRQLAADSKVILLIMVTDMLFLEFGILRMRAHS